MTPFEAIKFMSGLFLLAGVLAYGICWTFEKFNR